MYHDIDVLFTASVIVNFVFFMALMLATYTNGQLKRKNERLNIENRLLRRGGTYGTMYKEPKPYRKNRV